MCILLLDVEAGALLGDIGEVAMSHNLGVGITALQVFQKEEQGGLLLGSACVGISATVVLATDIAYADGVAVVVTDMGTSTVLGTAWISAESI